jgi:hypothetical protein
MRRLELLQLDCDSDGADHKIPLRLPSGGAGRFGAASRVPQVAVDILAECLTYDLSYCRLR